MREIVRDKNRLEHILESIDNVFEFTENMTFDDYAADKKGKFAVVKNLEIIGDTGGAQYSPFTTEPLNLLKSEHYKNCLGNIFVVNKIK